MQWNWSCMNTEYLRQQALQLNRERIEDKEVKRSMTYHRAHEEEQARIEYHQRKIEEMDEKTRYMEVSKPSASEPELTPCAHEFIRPSNGRMPAGAGGGYIRGERGVHRTCEGSLSCC